MPMKRFAMTFLAAALPLAPRFAFAQVVRIEVPSPVIQMPGNFPKLPIPTLPGLTPLRFEYLPNHQTHVPGVIIPRAGVPTRMQLAKPGARALPIASAAELKGSRASDFEKTLAVLRETFGLDGDGGPKTGAKIESTGDAFDGRRGRNELPEQGLERDLGVR